MSDTIVSVRMPARLASRLRELAEQHHYLDLSEELRAVIRHKCQQYLSPYSSELKKVVADLSAKIVEQQQPRDQVIAELERLVRQLKGGAK